MYRKQIFVLIILLLAIIGGTYYGAYRENSAVVLDNAEPDSETLPDREITVYVTGAVNRPGLVKIAEEARAADAVNACGGLLPTADSEKVNMAQRMKDGQQLRVPEKQGRNGQHESAKGEKIRADDERININTADEKALDTLPGIGPAMAKRIIEYRETEGAFQAIEDIKKIRGIGDAKFNKLKDKICI